MNCCYKPKVVVHDPYADWPDGEEGEAREMEGGAVGEKEKEEEASIPSPDYAQLGAVDVAADPVSGEETTVAAVYQEASEYEFDKKPSEMCSPSEIGDLV